MTHERQQRQQMQPNKINANTNPSINNKCKTQSEPMNKNGLNDISSDNFYLNPNNDSNGSVNVDSVSSISSIC